MRCLARCTGVRLTKSRKDSKGSLKLSEVLSNIDSSADLRDRLFHADRMIKVREGIMRRLEMVAAFTILLLSAATANAADVTLKLHHFLSEKSPAHEKFLVPWAEKIYQQSGGRIEIEISPSMSLGGKPPELYSQVKDGTADIVWTLPGYTPGVFPRSEVFELPTVHQGSARVTNLAIQKIWPMLKLDFHDVHPILLHVHAGNALHLRDKKVTSLAEVGNLKLRSPSRTGSWMIQAWGAQPVNMPAPALPDALFKGDIDGTLISFEVMPALRLHELTQFSVEGEYGSRFGTSVFMLAMNKDRYDSLPQDLKNIIDANSGMALADWVGKIWDELEEVGMKLQRESGSPIIQLSTSAKEEFNVRGYAVVSQWVREASGKGIDGLAIVNAARSAIEESTSTPQSLTENR